MDDIPPIEAAVAAHAALALANYEALDKAGMDIALLTHPVTKAMYSASLSLFLDRKPINPAAIIDTMMAGAIRRRLKITDEQIRQAAAVIAAPVASSDPLDIPDAIARLTQKHKRARLLGLAETIVREAEVAPDEDLDSVADAVVEKAISLSASSNQGKEDPRPSAQFALYCQRGEYGLSSGFRFYDAPPEDLGLGGVIPSSMTIATAATGHGKSTLAVSMVSNMCKIAVNAITWLREEDQGIAHIPRREINLLTVRAEEYDLPIRTVIERQADLRILYFSTEEIPGRLAMRIIQNALNLSAKEVRSRGYTGSLEALIASWFDFIDKHVMIYGLSNTAAAICRKIRQYRRSWGETSSTPLIVVDHIHRIVGLNKEGDQAGSKGNLNAFWRDVYTMIHDTTKQEGVHTLALDQLAEDAKREWEETNDLVSFRLKESGDSLTVTDNAILFGKSNKRLGASLGRIRKARYLEDARTIETPFYLKAYPQFARLTEIPKSDFDALEKMP